MQENQGIQIVVEDDRTGMTPQALERAFFDHVRFSQGKHPRTATPNDLFVSLALTVRDRLVLRLRELRVAVPRGAAVSSNGRQPAHRRVSDDRVHVVVRAEGAQRTG